MKTLKQASRFGWWLPSTAANITRRFLLVIVTILVMCPTHKLSAMEIFVTTQNGVILSINVQPGDLVETLKMSIQAKECIAPEQQRLVFEGQDLEDGRTLSNYNIQPLSTLQLLVQPDCVLSAANAGGGGSALTASYELNDTVGQSIMGPANSTNYIMEGGLWNDVNSAPLVGTPPTLEVTNLAGGISLANLLAAISDPDGGGVALACIDAVTALGGTITLNNGTVTYVPGPAFKGTDSFHYTVADADGNQITCVIDVLKVRPLPIIQPVVDQIAYVLIPVVITNYVSDPNIPLTFSLDAGAPAGSLIDPATGIFMWTPALEQARSTNSISVIVTDAGSPPASSTNTFRVVVDDYVKVSLGRMVVATGTTNGVPISLESSASLTNLQVVIQAPENLLISVAITDRAQGIADASLYHESSNYWRLEFAAAPGQALPSTQEMARVSFLGTARQSAIVPLKLAVVTNLDTDGQSVWRTLWDDGRAVVLAGEPLFEDLPTTNGLPSVMLYGLPGINHELLAASQLTGTSWQPIWQGPMPASGTMWINGLTNFGPSMFLRARASVP